jgi:hypothetical protein
MKVFKQISVFAMLLMMIFSSLGISFYLHNCHCSGDTTVGLRTGLSDDKMGSCCTSCSPTTGKTNQEPAFSKTDCCQSRVLFYLLPVAPDQSVKYFSPLAGIALFNIVTAFIADTKPAFLGQSFSLIHDPPAQRSGKLLIYFIRQIKIPFPAI